MFQKSVLRDAVIVIQISARTAYASLMFRKTARILLTANVTFMKYVQLEERALTVQGAMKSNVQTAGAIIKKRIHPTAAWIADALQDIPAIKKKMNASFQCLT